jgi:hypothetical protein
MANTDTLVKSAEVEEREPTLDDFVFERCDRCGHRAYVIAMKEDSTLSFCGHHGNKNVDALANSGWDILDFTDHI